jgi:thiaminase
MNAPNSLINAIDEQVNARRILLHPFYQRWTAGQLSREALADYAKQYYHHVAAFPAYLSAVHSNTEDGATRREILANLVDEEAGNRTIRNSGCVSRKVWASIAKTYDGQSFGTRRGTSSEHSDRYAGTEAPPRG